MRDPMRNPILEELWEIRDQIMREFDYDMDKYFDHLVEQQKSNGRTSVKLKPKRIKVGPIKTTTRTPSAKKTGKSKRSA